MATLTINPNPPLTVIRARAYRKSDKTTFAIPGTVTKIEDGAFEQCHRLADIRLPYSLVTIGTRVFEGCTSLTTVKIPGRVTFMSFAVFAGCSKLTKVEFCNDCHLKTIRVSTFAECRLLAKVELPNGLETIENEAFNGCVSLKTITFPRTVTCIGRDAFRNCHSLTELNLPRNLVHIKPRAFCDCANLRTIVFNDALMWIDCCTFQNCASLEQVLLPCDVQLVEENTFKGCKKLKHVAMSPKQKQDMVNFNRNHCPFRGCSSIEAFYAPLYRISDSVMRTMLGDDSRLVEPLRKSTEIFSLEKSYYWTMANHAQCSIEAEKAVRTVLLVALRLPFLPNELWHAILKKLCRADLGYVPFLRLTS